jgi:hypothetical protein
MMKPFTPTLGKPVVMSITAGFLFVSGMDADVAPGAESRKGFSALLFQVDIQIYVDATLSEWFKIVYR